MRESNRRNFGKPKKDRKDDFKNKRNGGNRIFDKKFDKPVSKKVIVKEEVVEKNENIYEDQVEGRNSVLELLESGKDINKIFVARGEKHGSINKIIAIAKERKIVLVEIEKSKLNTMAQTEKHQGVIAIVPPFDYCEVEDILNYAKSKKEDPFVIILDVI